MNASEILARLTRVRRTTNGWTGCCPAHQDRSPSLSVREVGDKILLHCFAGCSIEAICAALEIKVAELFYEPATYQRRPREVRDAEKQIAKLRSRLTPRERVLSATIVYCNADDVDAGIARALALAVEGEIVEAVLRWT